MDAADRALFSQSLRSITDAHTGPALDAALGELGWHDALTDDRRDAVELLFELQGAANATSSALDDVLADALGVSTGGAIVLPPLGKSTSPAIEADGGAVNRELIGLGMPTPTPPIGGGTTPTPVPVIGGVMLETPISAPPAPMAWTWKAYVALGWLSVTVAVLPDDGPHRVNGAPLIPCQTLYETAPGSAVQLRVITPGLDCVAVTWKLPPIGGGSASEPSTKTPHTAACRWGGSLANAASSRSANPTTSKLAGAVSDAGVSSIRGVLIPSSARAICQASIARTTAQRARPVAGW